MGCEPKAAKLREELVIEKEKTELSIQGRDNAQEKWDSEKRQLEVRQIHLIV